MHKPGKNKNFQQREKKTLERFQTGRKVKKKFIKKKREIEKEKTEKYKEKALNQITIF